MLSCNSNHTHYGSCAVAAFHIRRYMSLSCVRWPTARHRGLVSVLLPTMFSWNHSSADVRDLGTAAANSYHTETLLAKLTKLYSVVSWPMTGTSYNLSYLIVQPFHAVCEKGHTTRHCSTKQLISTMMTSSLECYIKTRINRCVFTVYPCPAFLLFNPFIVLVALTTSHKRIYMMMTILTGQLIIRPMQQQLGSIHTVCWLHFLFWRRAANSTILLICLCT